MNEIPEPAPCTLCEEKAEAYTYIRSKKVCTDCITLIVSLFPHRARK